MYKKIIKEKSQSTYQDRREERISRMEEKAQKATEKATAHRKTSDKIAERFFMGQPILVGHHSEKRARRDQSRMHGHMDKMVEADKKAEYYQDKAESAQNSGVISSQDPDAIKKLKEKIDASQARTDRMKKINSILRRKSDKKSGKTKTQELEEMGFSEVEITKLFVPDYRGKLGYPSYELSNESQNRKRMEKRVEELQRTRSREEIRLEYDSGVVIEESEDYNSTSIWFPDKPDPETLKLLKEPYFKWKWYGKSKIWTYRGRSDLILERAKQIADSYETELSQPLNLQ